MGASGRAGAVALVDDAAPAADQQSAAYSVSEPVRRPTVVQLSWPGGSSSARCGSAATGA